METLLCLWPVRRLPMDGTPGPPSRAAGLAGEGRNRPATSRTSPGKRVANGQRDEPPATANVLGLLGTMFVTLILPARPETEDRELSWARCTLLHAPTLRPVSSRLRAACSYRRWSRQRKARANRA